MVFKACRNLGLVTFPLYLLHRLAGATVMGYLAKAGFGNLGAAVGAVIIVIFASFLIAGLLEPWLQSHTKAALNWFFDRFSSERKSTSTIAVK